MKGKDKQKSSESPLEKKIKELHRNQVALEREVGELREHVQASHHDIATILLTLMQMQNTQLCAHSERVARWARELGVLCSLTDQELDDLEIAAILHDIGMMTIPGDLLRRIMSGAASEERVMKHPAVGYSLLCRIHGFDDIAKAVLHHHERYDGRGFPHKLWGMHIPLYARIIAVADIYDREMLRTGYLSTADPEEARRVIARERNHALDPELANKFLFILNTAEAAHRYDDREVAIAPGAIRSGMVLSRDLRSIDKVLLLKSGTILTEDKINRLFESDTGDWLATQVYVATNSLKAEELPIEPRRTSRPRLYKPRPLEEPKPKEKPKILVVDDSVAVGSALRRELGQIGMEVKSFITPAEALRALDEDTYDAVITDLVMRGSSGFDFLRAVERKHPGLHCVVLSGFPTPENIRALRAFKNVTRFVTKPWASDVLLSAVHESIDLKHKAMKIET